MERSTLCRELSKILTYLAMFGLFLHFYFIEEFLSYLDLKDTTTYVQNLNSKQSKASEIPAILFCNNNYKLTAAHKKYNLTNDARMFDQNDFGYAFDKIPSIPGKTKWDLYKEFTYHLDKHIAFSMRADSSAASWANLKEGSNQIGNISVELIEIPTISFDSFQCFKISINDSYYNAKDDNRPDTVYHIELRVGRPTNR